MARRAGSQLPAEIQTAVARMLRDDWSMSRISRHLDVSRDQVRTVARDSGYALVQPSRCPTCGRKGIRRQAVPDESSTIVPTVRRKPAGPKETDAEFARRKLAEARAAHAERLAK